MISSKYSDVLTALKTSAAEKEIVLCLVVVTFYCFSVWHGAVHKGVSGNNAANARNGQARQHEVGLYKRQALFCPWIRYVNGFIAARILSPIFISAVENDLARGC